MQARSALAAVALKCKVQRGHLSHPAYRGGVDARCGYVQHKRKIQPSPQTPEQVGLVRTHCMFDDPERNCCPCYQPLATSVDEVLCSTHTAFGRSCTDRGAIQSSPCSIKLCNRSVVEWYTDSSAERGARSWRLNARSTAEYRVMAVSLYDPDRRARTFVLQIHHQVHTSADISDTGVRSGAVRVESAAWFTRPVRGQTDTHIVTR